MLRLFAIAVLGAGLLATVSVRAADANTIQREYFYSSWDCTGSSFKDNVAVLSDTTPSVCNYGTQYYADDTYYYTYEYAMSNHTADATSDCAYDQLSSISRFTLGKCYSGSSAYPVSYKYTVVGAKGASPPTSFPPTWGTWATGTSWTDKDCTTGAEDTQVTRVGFCAQVGKYDTMVVGASADGSFGGASYWNAAVDGYSCASGKQYEVDLSATKCKENRTTSVPTSQLSGASFLPSPPAIAIFYFDSDPTPPYASLCGTTADPTSVEYYVPGACGGGAKIVSNSTHFLRYRYQYTNCTGALTSTSVRPLSVCTGGRVYYSAQPAGVVDPVTGQTLPGAGPALTGNLTNTVGQIISQVDSTVGCTSEPCSASTVATSLVALLAAWVFAGLTKGQF